jgi:hypothetical protein
VQHFEQIEEALIDAATVLKNSRAGSGDESSVQQIVLLIELVGTILVYIRQTGGPAWFY